MVLLRSGLSLSLLEEQGLVIELRELFLGSYAHLICASHWLTSVGGKKPAVSSPRHVSMPRPVPLRHLYPSAPPTTRLLGGKASNLPDCRAGSFGIPVTFGSGPSRNRPGPPPNGCLGCCDIRNQNTKRQCSAAPSWESWTLLCH